MWLQWPPCSATPRASPLHGGAQWLLSPALLQWQENNSFTTGMSHERGRNLLFLCWDAWQGSLGPQRLWLMWQGGSDKPADVLTAFYSSGSCQKNKRPVTKAKAAHLLGAQMYRTWEPPPDVSYEAQPFSRKMSVITLDRSGSGCSVLWFNAAWLGLSLKGCHPWLPALTFNSVLTPGQEMKTRHMSLHI